MDGINADKGKNEDVLHESERKYGEKCEERKRQKKKDHGNVGKEKLKGNE
jgi:hypothetical protein